MADSITRPQLNTTDSASILGLVKSLNLSPHPEGGYFLETDRDHLLVSPFPPPQQSSDNSTVISITPSTAAAAADSDKTRNIATTIYYFLTPSSPVGHFHRNEARIMHTIQRGRARYVLVHPDGRVETFVVGHDLAAGERMQWIVDGGVWKATFVLPDREGGSVSESGMLITEVCVPGWDVRDHRFMAKEELVALVGGDDAAKLEWLLHSE